VNSKNIRADTEGVQNLQIYLLMSSAGAKKFKIRLPLRALHATGTTLV